MNSYVGYFVFQVLPAIGALTYTAYLAYTVVNPSRLNARMSKLKGMSKYDLYRKFYNRYFLLAWVFISLFFVSGIAFDLYRSAHTPPTFIVLLAPAVTLTAVFAGAAFAGRALRK